MGILAALALPGGGSLVAASPSWSECSPSSDGSPLPLARASWGGDQPKRRAFFFPRFPTRVGSQPREAREATTAVLLDAMPREDAVLLDSTPTTTSTCSRRPGRQCSAARRPTGDCSHPCRASPPTSVSSLRWAPDRCTTVPWAFSARHLSLHGLWPSFAVPRPDGSKHGSPSPTSCSYKAKLLASQLPREYIDVAPSFTRWNAAEHKAEVGDLAK